MSNFKNKVVSKIKGDEAEVVATRVESRAKAAFAGQVAALAASKVEAGIKLDDAKLALEDAFYPAGDINGSTYIQNIKLAQAKADAALDAVEAIDESIEYYQDLSETLFSAE